VSARRPQLDLLSPAAVVGLVLEAEQRVVPAVRDRTAEIARAATLVADRLGADGRIAFAGAGTSGRIALAEAAELPGTFGLPRHRVPACVAGGPTSTDLAEDDLDLAAADARALALTGRDVLVAVAASGSTPYTLALARAAKDAGSAVVAVTAARPSPLADLADVAIEVCVAPEVVRGSSRLTAGTAQKIVLNALTTSAMAQLGRVHGDLMIDVEPANGKLRGRLADIVADIADCSPAEATGALERCGDNGRAAVVHLVAGLPPEHAKEIAAGHARLRDALTAAGAAMSDAGDTDA
jgi:N-acetylmuramic acid 6-phosphate etherase